MLPRDVVRIISGNLPFQRHGGMPLVVKVATLTNGNLLQNADDGHAVVGAT
jgi:hypothetical protein